MMRIEHQQTEDERQAIIGVEGLERPLTLMHVTDSHMAAADERDPEVLEAAAQCQELFKGLTPGGVSPKQLFEQALERSNSLAVDCTILTGDIINFPARAAIEIIERGVNGLRGPWLYTLGNHDWHFPHLQWCDATREQFYPRLAHLAGDSPAAQVMELGGVRLVVLDNSNYQVTGHQLDFLRGQLQTGEPCLLFVHIPLYTPALAPPVLEKWKAPIVMAAPGWTPQAADEWRVREADASTSACHALVTLGEADNLVGVFCGHVHFSHAGEVRPGRMQYVTREGFRGGYRLIRLEPL
jgi:predicted phosphodiesterase